MKFAYFVVPHLGGTYTLFRNLRDGLARFGIELRWLGCGAAAHDAVGDPLIQAELRCGDVVGQPGDGAVEQARAMIRAIEEGGFDGVFVNVLADPIQTNLVRYLGPHLLRIMVVVNVTPGTYAAARSIRHHVHATVGVSPRIRADLVAGTGFDPDWIVTIPNGTRLPPAPDRIAPGSGLRLLSVGRIEDQSKGILWLPRILAETPEHVILTVGGDGPDLARLKTACAPLGRRVVFRGAVAPDHVAALFAAHDVFVMPSRYEGFPLTLVEAMAAGCVPVASRLRGITDAAVDDGENGCLFRVGDTAEAAGMITRLARDPSLVADMSARASRSARQRFGIEAMADSYRNLILRLCGSPPPVAASLDLAQWRLPAGLRPGLRSLLPTPIKNLIRTFSERRL